MNPRQQTITRRTAETDITVSLSLDGTKSNAITTSIGFFDHMLTLFARHGGFGLDVRATGDTFIEPHHLVEDTGIVLGTAFAGALGDKRGIARYGFFILPMDEALATTAVDLSGRYAFRFDCPFVRENIGTLPTELLYDFWDAFAQNARMNLFLQVKYGRNDHHKAEAMFKSAARALKMACVIDGTTGNAIPSTKGII